ncbi:MAG: hypothetical protein VX589_19150 [Myxococcota bacterium]|nr:hypothetical protein [Myxococcota bacterium]
MNKRNLLAFAAALITAGVVWAQPKAEPEKAPSEPAPTAAEAAEKPAAQSGKPATNEGKPADQAAKPDDKGATKAEGEAEQSSDAKWGPTSSQSLKICDLYESAALIKAKAKTEVSATCKCAQTKTECGKNWRGAMKYEFDCQCELRGSCEVTKCAGSDITATAKASATCRKGNCSCVKQGDAVCGKGLMGGEKHSYQCKCP